MTLADLYMVISDTLVQLIYEHSNTDISSVTVLFSRSVATVAMAFMFIAISRIYLFPSKRETLALCVLGLTGVSSILFTYLALSLIPVGDVTVIQFTAPIFTSVMGFVLLNQPCSLMDAFFEIISFCGVFIMTCLNIIFGKHDTESKHKCESVIEYENKVFTISATARTSTELATHW